MELPAGEEQLEDNPFPTLEEWRKAEIIKRMDHFKWNKTKVADSLGITIKTLYNLLHQYGLHDIYVRGK